MRPEEVRRRTQSDAEELANSVTHGLGAVLAVAALVLLVVFASLQGDPWRIVGLAIFGATLIKLYLASTLYHAVRDPRVKQWLQVLDHAAIFLLIAGTYTPVILVYMRHPWGWALFGLVWGLALIGIVSRFRLGPRWRRISLALYVAMGWSALLALPPMLRGVPRGLLIWLLAGGICYTLGVVVYRMERVRFHHAVWHLFVLGGSACHVFGLLFYTAMA